MRELMDVRILSPSGRRFQESDDRKEWTDVPPDGRLTKRYVRETPPSLDRYHEQAERGLTDG